MTEERKEDSTEKTARRSGVSRREFIAGTVGGVVVGAVVGAAAGSLGFPRTVTQVHTQTETETQTQTQTQTQTSTQTTTSVTTAQPWLPAKWDQTADVVVVGTGLAGLSAAIAAHDAGANVLILEKLTQALEGGNSRVSGQQFFAPTDPNTLAPDAAQGATYLQANACGTVPDATIFPAQAQGYIDNIAWVKSLGGNVGTSSGGTSYPNAPGASVYHTFAISPAGTAVASNGYPVGSTGDSKLWQLFRSAVTSRNINVLYSSPATSLIQNSNTREILGVTASSGGSTLNIKANKAVVLACGSIEFAHDLQKQFWPASPVYSTGSPGNTGDGVRMAQRVGANIWHMNAVFPSYGAFVMPGTDPSVVGVVPVAAKGIQVNKLGNRFNMGTAVNGPVGGFGNETNASFLFDATTLDWDSVPCWAIFDDTARLKGPIMSTTTVASTGPGVGGVSSWFVIHSGLTWSSDNSAEIAKGWILSANDLNTLATTIAADPDNGGKMTGAQLTATVTAYNQDVANKSDAQFLTSSALLTAINGPPFYAMKLWPNTTNAAAGPQRNIKCQVLDPTQQAIPRLYSAGELGAFWGWGNSSGTHLAECMFTGRTAGTNAAAETAQT